MLFGYEEARQTTLMQLELLISVTGFGGMMIASGSANTIIAHLCPLTIW